MTPDQAATMLLEVDDSHFAWMLGRRDSPVGGLTLPPGGIDGPETLRIVRGMSRVLRATGSKASWMMVAEGEAVGLCSYKQPPKDGRVEIGYGVAASRRGRGHATRAVSAMLDYARTDPAVSRVIAETAVANIASQRTLERNGFTRYGAGRDPDDGPTILWHAESI